jgi:hypothetical protein
MLRQIVAIFSVVFESVMTGSSLSCNKPNVMIRNFDVLLVNSLRLEGFT